MSRRSDDNRPIGVMPGSGGDEVRHDWPAPRERHAYDAVQRLGMQEAGKVRRGLLDTPPNQAVTPK